MLFSEKKGCRIAFLAVSMASVIAVTVCVITDFAINRTITWSTIPAASVLFAWLLTAAVLMPERHRAMTGLLALTGLLYPFLLLLERLVDRGQWAAQLALPLCLCGLGAAWVIYGAVRLRRLNALCTAGVIVAVSGVGLNLGASAIVGRFLGENLIGPGEIITAGSALAAALLLLIVGLGIRGPGRAAQPKQSM